MDASESCYALGKYFGRLDAIVQIMKRRIDSDVLQLRISAILDQLQKLDLKVENVCSRQDFDNDGDKEELMKKYFAEAETLDKAFHKVLEIVEATTGISSLFD